MKTNTLKVVRCDKCGHKHDVSTPLAKIGIICMVRGCGGSVKSQSFLDRRNAEIAVPVTLKTEDGRDILVQSWTPTVSVDDITTVVITGIIRLPREEE